jgi:hypothetical protein
MGDVSKKWFYLVLFVIEQLDVRLPGKYLRKCKILPFFFWNVPVVNLNRNERDQWARPSVTRSLQDQQHRSFQNLKNIIIMQMARSERSLKMKRQDKIMSKMLRDLDHHRSSYPSSPSNMFASPTQSVFKKRTKKSPSDQWKKRCQRHFHRLLRGQDSDSNSHFTRVSQLIQTKSMKLSPHTQSMSYEDVVALFWQIGDKCSNIIQFDLSYIPNCTFESIRAVLITPSFSANLIILRARAQDAIDDQSLRLFSTRCFSLKVIDFGQCRNVSDTGLRFLLNSANIEAISLSGCKQITGGTLRALTGELAHCRLDAACTNLELLDVSHCPLVHDLGWIAFGHSGVTGKYQMLNNVHYLNLEKIGNNDTNDTKSSMRYRTTETGLCAALRCHNNVLVLNVSNNLKLVTNASMKVIGKHMRNLVSLNVSRNRKITDVGISYIAKGCRSIQAMNISGLGKLTTPGIYQLLKLRAQSMKLLNMNGLQGTLPVSLILPLCKHLPYAMPAVTFYGFKPINDVEHQKLIQQWTFIEHAAAQAVQSRLRGKYDRAKVRLLQNVMSNRIQFCWRIYNAKQKYQQRKQKLMLQTAASIQLQKWAKIILWRMEQTRNEYKQSQLAELLKRLGKSATVLSSLYRGHYMRHNHHSPISDVMIHLNSRRSRILRQNGIYSVVVLQRKFRKYINQLRRQTDNKEQEQRKIDCYLAVRVLQQSIRIFNAKMKLHYLWEEWNSKNQRIYNACVTLQCLIRCYLSIQLKLRLRQLRREGIKRKHQAASTIQAALTRGLRGRTIGYEFYSLRYNAAVKIQALMRSTFVGHWSSMSPDLLYEKWKDKASYEIMEALQNATLRTKMEDMEGNSASESDEEWEPVWDHVNDCQMYFSAKRNATRRDPSSLRQWERSLVHQKIMLFDQERWVKATVKKYNSWKNKWKVILADSDGDYHWIDLKERHDLVMMRQNGEFGDWCMLRNLFPPRRDVIDL